MHNWIDTDGLLEGILTLRMAEFPEGGARPDLSATRPGGQARPARRRGARRCRGSTPDERAAQLAERRAAYLRRLPGGGAA